MKKEREYTIIKVHRGKSTEITGTLDYIRDYFGYTLEIGHSYNSKIKLHPTTIKSLVSNIQKSLDIKYSNCFERDYIQLKEEVG